jgi:hypothetical protein
LRVSQNILPCQHRTDVAGEACHRSRQRDFHRLDGVALQHLHHFLLEATSIALTESAGLVSGSAVTPTRKPSFRRLGKMEVIKRFGDKVFASDVSASVAGADRRRLDRPGANSELAGLQGMSVPSSKAHVVGLGPSRYFCQALKRTLSEQPFRRDVSELDVNHKKRLNPNGLGLSIGLVSFDFGLTTVSGAPGFDSKPSATSWCRPCP